MATASSTTGRAIRMKSADTLVTVYAPRKANTSAASAAGVATVQAIATRRA
jgi:hypothetical protein